MSTTSCATTAVTSLFSADCGICRHDMGGTSGGGWVEPVTGKRDPNVFMSLVHPPKSKSYGVIISHSAVPWVWPFNQPVP